MANPRPAPNVDPAIFQFLQDKIDEEGKIRDELKEIVQTLEKQGRLISEPRQIPPLTSPGRVTQSILSRIHNTPTAQLPTVLTATESALSNQATAVQLLSTTASKYPFYKWNQTWQHQIQGLLTSVQLTQFLRNNTLITLPEVGQLLSVPVNLKDTDAFHITIEDYLLALTATIEELARLAPNAVTLGDFARPLQISRFVKDVHAGFQLLNLKNDNLRRKSDGVKYSVKKVEDVVYDLSLRGLLPKEEVTSITEEATS